MSVDNVFVWAVIFGYFSVPKQFQHRVLFWGIFGASVLRAIFVFAGVALLSRFEWLMFVFGAFLVYTAVKVARGNEHEIHPEDNPLLKLVRRVIAVSSTYDGQKLFTRVNGRGLATPLFVVLILIGATDVVFAVDSVPASWPSAVTSSWSSAPTPRPFSGCARSTSCWPALDFVRLRAECEAELTQRWCDPLATAGVAFETRMIEDQPVEALVTVADEVDADLIVVAARAQSALRGLLLGSTSLKLPHETTRPVCIVHPERPSR